MVADVEWTNLTVAGAFLLGAAVATIATLRVVRYVSAMFGVISPRRRHRGLPEELDGEEEEL